MNDQLVEVLRARSEQGSDPGVHAVYASAGQVASKRRTRRRVALPVAAVVLVAVLALGVLALNRGGSPARVSATATTSTGTPTADSFGEPTKACSAPGLTSGISVGGPGGAGICVGIDSAGGVAIADNGQTAADSGFVACKSGDDAGVTKFQAVPSSDGTSKTIFGSVCQATSVEVALQDGSSLIADTFELPSQPGLKLFALVIPANASLEYFEQRDANGAPLVVGRVGSGPSPYPVPTLKLPADQAAAWKAAFQTLADCMHEHGVLDYPNAPATFGDGQTASPTIDGDAPGIQAGAAACPPFDTSHLDGSVFAAASAAWFAAHPQSGGTSPSPTATTVPVGASAQ